MSQNLSSAAVLIGTLRVNYGNSLIWVHILFAISAKKYTSQDERGDENCHELREKC